MATADALYKSILARVERSELHEQMDKVVRQDLESMCSHLSHASLSIAALRQLQAAAAHVRPGGDWLPVTFETRLKRIEELQLQMVTKVDQFSLERRMGKWTKLERKRKRKSKSLDDDAVGVKDEKRCAEGTEVGEDDVEMGLDEVVMIEMDRRDEGDVEKRREAELAFVFGGRKEEEEETMWCGKRDHTETKMVEVKDEQGQQQRTKGNELNVAGVNVMTADELMKEEEEENVIEVTTVIVVDNKELASELIPKLLDVPVRVKEELVMCDNGQTLLEKVGFGSEAKELANEVAPKPEDAPLLVTEEPAMCIYGHGLPEDEGCGLEAKELTKVIVPSSQDALLPVKKESVMCADRFVSSKDEEPRLDHYAATAGIAKSALNELTISESSSESAVELEVPDSDSDEAFSPVHETVKRLKNSRASTQLVMLPAAVDLLRAYLIDHKYMTVVEMDGCLFTHKPFTGEEAHAICRTIETIISVVTKLPMRPKIKLALCDLFTTVEQLELALGELPESLRPATNRLSTYFNLHVGRGCERWKF
ncbi:unnamed protein product [Hyaloperonospora brassicae]|uniref:Uncharacterized protein n=1 Tax=Hyaloperonospora brassicae TaxID=162125 RepID=A0AAV0UGP8_HYABA|nr:unnamed protein product [Hyaloperonospora brassicae]